MSGTAEERVLRPTMAKDGGEGNHLSLREVLCIPSRNSRASLDRFV